MITPRDWEQVRDLFHRAVQRPAEDRAAFVRNHAGSAQVLREVESLLAAQPEAEGFLSTPAYALGPQPAAPRLPAESRLGHFEILGLLGAGGDGRGVPRSRRAARPDGRGESAVAQSGQLTRAAASGSSAKHASSRN